MTLSFAKISFNKLTIFSIFVCLKELSTFQTFDYDSIKEGNFNTTELNQELNYTVINIVTGEEGKAELPCLIEKPNNDTIDLILWFRGNSETALYSLDARRTPFQMAKHFPNANLSTRAYIQTNEQTSSLIIEWIKPEDAGEYRCRVDFRKGRTQYRVVNLEVLIGPKDVIIMDEYGQRLRDVAGPFNEQSYLTLICEVEEGTPKPSLVWYKDGNLLDDSWTETPQGIIRNELFISKLERKDLMSKLACTASNSNLTKSASSSIQLDLNLKPLTVEIISLERPLSIEKTVDLICQTTGSRPPAIVTWWKGPNRMYQVTEEVSSHENLTQSNLHYRPSPDDNGEFLICRADHSILPNSAIEDSWTLDIYYAPRVSLSFGASISSDEVVEGNDVYFECHIQANPMISYIGWKVDSKPLMEDETLGIFIKNQSLFLHNVTKYQSGNYNCEAANIEGKGKSDQVNFKVLYAPKCKENQKLLYGVGTREPIELPCEVEADPPQVTFKWALNNSFEIIPIKNFVIEGLLSTANYAPRTKYGYGQMFCWATNKVGQQKEPCIFNIVPAGPPQPIQNCLVGNQSSDSLVIKCEPGEDGGLEQSFHLEVYHSISGIIQANLSSNKSPVFEVHYLTKGTPFLLALYAANAKGRSNTVALAASTLPFSNREYAMITPVLAILIAIISSLAFIALIIVMIAKCKKNDTNQDSSSRSEPKHVRKVNHENDNNDQSSFHRNDKPNPSEYDLKLFKDGNGSWSCKINSDDKLILTKDSIEDEFKIKKIEENKMEPSPSNSFSEPMESIARVWISNQSNLNQNSIIIMNDNKPTLPSELPLMNGLIYSNFDQNKQFSTLI